MISTCWLNPQFLNLVKNWKIWKDWILTELFYEIFIPRKIFNKNSQIVVHIKILNTLQRECIRMYKSAKTPPARGHFWTRLGCTVQLALYQITIECQWETPLNALRHQIPISTALQRRMFLSGIFGFKSIFENAFFWKISGYLK